MNISHRIVFLATFALAALSTRIDAATSAEPFADTPWQVRESTDEITDETSYYVFTTGSKVGNGLMHYAPNLVIRVKPKGLTPTGGMKYKPEVMIQLGDFDGIDRHGCELTLRYDKRKPLVETWIPSTDRRAMFAPDDMKTFKRLEVSTNLTARFTTTLGHVRTSTFNVTGLTNALSQVKAKYLATNPPTILDAKPASTPPPQSDVTPTKPARKTTAARKPAAPPCSKCKGKGTISGWKPCPNCNGTVMPGGSRCKTCIKSIHVGKIRGEIPCPKCHNTPK